MVAKSLPQCENGTCLMQNGPELEGLIQEERTMSDEKVAIIVSK